MVAWDSGRPNAKHAERPKRSRQTVSSLSIKLALSVAEASRVCRLTRNSKSLAVGVMTVISCAVEALCSALGPGDANDTLPTRTF